MKNWLNNKVITKEIDGEQVEFRRIPIGTLQKFRGLSEPVAKALAMLFKDTTHDVQVENMSTPSGEKDAEGVPYTNNSSTVSAAEPSIISLRKTQMEEGIKGIINIMTQDDSLDIIAEIIAKSAHKEEWPEDLSKIKDNMDIVTMIEFLKGAFEASAGDYADLGKSLFQSRKVQDVLDKVQDQM